MTSTRTPTIKIGSSIEWSSMAGELAGIVKEIQLDYTADGKINPWLIIEQVFIKNEDGFHSFYKSPKHKERLLGTHSYMKMMSVKIDNVPVQDWKI